MAVLRNISQGVRLRLIFRYDTSNGNLAQDRDRRRALLNAVMNLRGPKKCGEFLVYL